MKLFLHRLILLMIISIVAVPQAVFAGPSAISISSATPVTTTVGLPVTVFATVSSSAGSISSCNLYVDNDDKGAMAINSGTASKDYTFPNAQIYTVFVFCRDSAGNFNSGPNSAMWAKALSGGGDTTLPVVGAVSPSVAEVGKTIIFSANVYDNVGIAVCNLFVGGVDQGTMSVSSGHATKSHTFTAAGTTSAYVQCADSASNKGTGSLGTVNVSPAPIQITPATPPSAPVVSSLIKLECPAGATADHPCKAVYYSGNDGKRHAFPNEKVFFTWYANFDSVQTVTQSKMSSLVLGKNVTYRPGSKMIKFPTVPKVYAVSKDSVLRWVKTEADAVSIYGAEWNKKVDDISEAFFMDYKYGSDITPSASYNVGFELDSSPTIDSTL